MKIETIFILLLVTALIFGISAGIIGDFKTYYPEKNVMNETNLNKFNYQTQLNNSLSDVSKNIQDIGKESSGWVKILGGISVLWSGIKFIFIFITCFY